MILFEESGVDETIGRSTIDEREEWVWNGGGRDGGRKGIVGGKSGRVEADLRDGTSWVNAALTSCGV